MSMPTGFRAEAAVPHQRPAAAAAEIDDEIAGRRPQELAQHVVADLRPEERRRDPLVARVDVQRFVEVLGPLGELVGRMHVEELTPRRGEDTAAAVAGERGRQPAAAVGAAHEGNETIRNHRRDEEDTTSLNSASSRAARSSQLYSATALAAAAASLARSAASSASRRMPCARAAASPGATSTA